MRFRHSWRRYQKTVLALLFCCSAAVTAHAVDFMPVDAIRTGMEGQAKTVIQGDTISTFGVKVLGIMKDKGPSGHLILAKFSGPVMDETGGIVHGMSGSPVYINGKLVGAVAYGWGFTDGKIGMITPIEDMVKLWDINYEKNKINPWKDDRLIPLDTPLMAYGFDAASLDYLKNKLPDYHYAMYDTAAVDGDDVKKPLVAGGSVAALLVDGDLKLGAIGTVTYVDKNRIVAFGHPFLKRGSVDYFMHNASILGVVKSMSSGFKLGTMGAEVGAVNEDRGAGIAGEEGVLASGIPIYIHVRDLDTGSYRDAQVKVIDADEMTPALASSAVYNFINKTIDRTGEGTATVSYEVVPRNKDVKPLERTNMFYSDSSISAKSVDEFYNVLDSLMNNRFINYDITGVNVNVDVTQAKESAKIGEATISRTIVAPGDVVTIKVDLQPYRGKTFTKEILYTIPKNQPYGSMQLEIRGGGMVPLPYLIEKQKYNLTDEIIRRLRTYKNFDDFYKKLKKTETNNQLIVEILEDGVSMVNSPKDGGDSNKPALSGEEKNPLPGDIKPKDSKNLVGADDNDNDKGKVSIDTNYIIRGEGQFTLQVVPENKRDGMLKKLALSRMKEAENSTTAVPKWKQILQGTDEADADNKDQDKDKKASADKKDSTDKKESTDKKDNKATQKVHVKKATKTSDAAKEDANKASSDKQK